MAKAKREKLRQARLAPDYLPLGGTSRVLSKDFMLKEKKINSKSDQEEDEDDIEDTTRVKVMGEIQENPYL